jgi:hypothetical protein
MFNVIAYRDLIAFKIKRSLLGALYRKRSLPEALFTGSALYRKRSLPEALFTRSALYQKRSLPEALFTRSALY